jgi:hypothetical protein
VPVSRILLRIGDGSFRCPHCGYLSYPSARDRSSARFAAFQIIAAGVVALALSGKFGLAAAIGVIAVVGYVISAMNDFTRNKPMR